MHKGVPFALASVGIKLDPALISAALPADKGSGMAKQTLTAHSTLETGPASEKTLASSSSDTSLQRSVYVYIGVRLTCEAGKVSGCGGNALQWYIRNCSVSSLPFSIRYAAVQATEKTDQRLFLMMAA